MKNASFTLFGTTKVRPLFPLKDNIDHFPVTKIILEREFIMKKHNGMAAKTKIANLSQLSIQKRTQPINLHEPSSARPLETFISTEYSRHILPRPVVLHLISN